MAGRGRGRDVIAPAWKKPSGLLEHGLPVPHGVDAPAPGIGGGAPAPPPAAPHGAAPAPLRHPGAPGPFGAAISAIQAQGLGLGPGAPPAGGPRHHGSAAAAGGGYGAAQHGGAARPAIPPCGPPFADLPPEPRGGPPQRFGAQPPGALPATTLPTGARPPGGPPAGAPPAGAPFNGAPPNCAPPNGAPPNGAPPNGAPPSGAPPNGAPPFDGRALAGPPADLLLRGMRPQGRWRAGPAGRQEEPQCADRSAAGGGERGELTPAGVDARGDPQAASRPARAQRVWHGEEWRRDVLAFANAPSVELEVLVDQGSGQGGDAVGAPRLDCRQGEVVAGVECISAGTAEGDLVRCVVYRDGVRSEGSLPRASCRPCGVHHFLLNLSVGPAESLGLRGEMGPQGLQVQEVVSGGAVEKWNDGCARVFMRDLVRVGDCIVGANGHWAATDPFEALLSLRRGPGAFAILVSRGMGGVLADADAGR